MQHHRNLTLPETLPELIDPQRTALLVYDMQAGIVPFVRDPERIKANVTRLVEAAHRANVPVYFSRHYNAPLESAGRAQLWSNLRFQRTRRVADLKPHLLKGSPEYQLIPELAPGPQDTVIDKLGMSFFVGTPLEFCLRDLGIITVVIAGCVAEIGVVPTLTHAMDLGFLGVAVSDACGSLSEANHQSAITALRFNGTIATIDEVSSIWLQHPA